VDVVVRIRMITVLQSLYQSHRTRLNGAASIVWAARPVFLHRLPRQFSSSQMREIVAMDNRAIDPDVK
jgi:hypothetical protein